MNSRAWPPCIDAILEREGSRFTDYPDDNGGPTKWGVTLAAWRAYVGTAQTVDDLRAITRQQAGDLYVYQYIRKPGYARLPDSELRDDIVDAAVNSGPHQATLWLQRAVNALNRMGADYADIAVDGDCGPATADAVRALVRVRASLALPMLAFMLNAQRATFCLQLTAREPSQERWMVGWTLRIMRLRHTDPA